MDEIAKKVFLTARDHYESAARWHFLGILMLLLFHITVLNPYAEMTRHKVELEIYIEEQQSLSADLQNSLQQLESLSKSTVQHFWTLFDKLLEELSVSFHRLDTAVQGLQRMGPAAAAGEEGQQLIAYVGSNSMYGSTLQQGALPSMIDLPMMDATVRESVSRAASRDELLRSIESYVNDSLMVKAFGILTDRWRSTGFHLLHSKAEILLRANEDAVVRYKEHQEVFENIGASVRELQAFAKEVDFSPPEDPYWWRTTSGKESEIKSLFYSINEQLVALKPSSEAYELEAHVQTAIDHSQRLSEELGENIASLKNQFQEQLSQISAYVEPLKGVAIELDIVARQFPLILGLLLGAMITWRAYRLTRLCQILDFAGDSPEASTARVWTARLVGSSNKYVILQSATLSMVLSVWIAVGAYSTISFPGRTLYEVIGLAVTGIALVAGATWYSLRIAKKARTLESR